MINYLLNLCGKIANFIVKSLVLQLFLMSLSFPILVSWGIGFSPLIFLGNIIFTPILTLFLALSCAIYTLELLGLPSGYICYPLDKVTLLWVKLLALAPELPMFACPKAPWWVLVIMPLGAWVILRTVGMKRAFLGCLVLSAWVGLVFFGIKWNYTPVEKEITVACGARTVTCVLRDKKIFLIDSSAVLSSRACSESWIDYTLSSELVKNFGATTLDVIMVAKPDKKTDILCKKYKCAQVVYLQKLGNYGTNTDKTGSPGS